jgi:hypothetical protein
MDELIRLGNLHQQTAEVLRTSSSTDADSHQPHPLVTFGRGDEEEKPKPRIKPSQIYQNYKKVNPKSLNHATSKKSA